MYVFKFSNWVLQATISALVLNEFVKRPVEMNPTASKTCSRLRHLLEDLLTNSMFTPPDPSGTSLGVKLLKRRCAGKLLKAAIR